MVGKKVPTEDGSFRIEVPTVELEQLPQMATTDFFAEWVNSIKKDKEEWDKLSEEEKIAYQKEYYETERYFYYEDENGKEVPYLRWKLNTDWTFDLWDMGKGVEYYKCYPISMNSGDRAPLSDPKGIFIEYSFTKGEKND